MIDKIKRPLLDKEKRTLGASIVSLKRNMSGLYKRISISSLIVFGVLWGLTMLVAKAPWQFITLFWLCIGVGISLWVIVTEKKKFLRRIDSFEDAMNKNEADVVHIKSAEMVEFEEIEDEGAAYAFQVDDENIIFVTGQDFYSSAKFPNDDFEIIYIYDRAGNLVEMLIDKHGNKLNPVRKISAEVKKKLRLFDHLEIIKGKLADLEQILKT